LVSFGEALRVLAEDAAGMGIKLCVEHVPGRALATAKEGLAFIEQVNHPNLYLLLDVGHSLLSKEKAWEIVAAAGKRLGYVQMNDNDGRNDRHWALLDGRLTYADLQKTLEALKEAGYEGTLGLELSYDRVSLVSGFSRNRNLLIRIQEASDHKSLREPEVRRKK
jgi:D-psicose/D-tagatose/L-ribulose 3-epimerase